MDTMKQLLVTSQYLDTSFSLAVISMAPEVTNSCFENQSPKQLQYQDNELHIFKVINNFSLFNKNHSNHHPNNGHVIKILNLATMKGSKIIYNKHTIMLLKTMSIFIHYSGQNSYVISLQREDERSLAEMGVRTERTEKVSGRSLNHWIIINFVDRLIMSLITHYEHTHAHKIT